MPQASRIRRWGRPFLLALTLFLIIGLGFEAGSAQEGSGGWVFSSLPEVDLWFHGMALVDPIGPGPNPLYDSGYPNEVRRAKESSGVYPTGLDGRLGYFRDAFRRDPAFEVLHFLPLYFARAGRTELFTALKLLAAAEKGIPRAPSARTSFGVAAVGSVLTTRSQRRVLGEFVEALEGEWADFFESYWQGGAVQRGRLEASLQDGWRKDYLPAIAPLLKGLGMSGGIVALAPAIGVEGRIFGGSPEDPADNVLVVSAPAGADKSLEAVFSMLRELSFPLVRGVMSRLGSAAGNPDEEESLAARAAIRSGALILEMYRPDDLMAYQRFFLSRVGSSPTAGEADAAAFRMAYPLEAGFEEALREKILTTVTNGGAG